MIASSSFQTIVFLDVETTGFIRKGNDGESTKTRITELSFIAISREQLLQLDRQEPRVYRKLVIPVNPLTSIGYGATKLHGLTNQMLENEGPMNENKVNMMRSFFGDLQAPVCLIAHNGLSFDFPLLKNELKSFPKVFAEDVGFADSLKCFRQLKLSVPDENANANGDGGARDRIKYSYSLEAIYKRIFGSEVQFHAAEEDAMALLKCCIKYKDIVMEWIDTNYVKFDDIRSL